MEQTHVNRATYCMLRTVKRYCRPHASLLLSQPVSQPAATVGAHVVTTVHGCITTRLPPTRTHKHTPTLHANAAEHSKHQCQHTRSTYCKHAITLRPTRTVNLQLSTVQRSTRDRTPTHALYSAVLVLHRRRRKLCCTVLCSTGLDFMCRQSLHCEQYCAEWQRGVLQYCTVTIAILHVHSEPSANCCTVRCKHDTLQQSVTECTAKRYIGFCTV